MDVNCNAVDSDTIVQLCEAHHAIAFTYLKVTSRESDVWEKLATVIQNGEVLQRDVLRLIFKQRPSVLQARLLQVLKMSINKVNEPVDLASGSNGKSKSKAAFQNEYQNSNILWKNSGIPDAVANDCELFKICCDTFFDLFIDCNFSRRLYVLLTGFYRRLLAVSTVGFLHYVPPYLTLMVEALSVVENISCPQICKSFTNSINEELKRLMMENKSGPPLLAIFCVYPRSFLLLRNSQIFMYFFSQLRFYRRCHV